jgi:GT2 family glycosyltransferase
MDEDYFTYGDDADWCLRFRRAGWKVMFAPVAEIIHYGGQTTKKAGANKFALQLYGSIFQYISKHYGWVSFTSARVLTALYLLLRTPYWLGRALLSTDDRGKALASARTYFTGAFYCLLDWQALLMNREALAQKAAVAQVAAKRQEAIGKL